MFGAGGGYNMKLIFNGGLSIKVRFLENILYILRYLYHTHSYIQYVNQQTQSVKHKSWSTIHNKCHIPLYMFQHREAIMRDTGSTGKSRLASWVFWLY